MNRPDRKYILVALLGMCTACGMSTQPSDTRSDSRASISGRVLLSDIAGLNDTSRVRIDLGKGEGGSNLEADGTFSIVSNQYTGSTGGVGSGTANGSKGYGINGIRLKESFYTPTSIVINEVHYDEDDKTVRA